MTSTSMAASQPQLSFTEVLKILWPYARENFMDQIKGIWFIVFYLAFFQIVILQLPLVYALTIAAGILIVALGLMFFMEGLRLGLMPLGEKIGTVLPRSSPLWGVLVFAFILGVGATFAEPAIAVLRSAGAGVKPDQAPLLYSMLNDFSDQLVMVVGIGVGIAVALGILRFYFNWSLKLLIIPGVIILTALTLFAHNNDVMQPILGLAWDCGAVTTGPVTVPLVLALGIGVCRVMSDGDTSNAGFGIVTLASLFPILAVLSLGFYHLFASDYYGQENYQGQIIEKSITLDRYIEMQSASKTSLLDTVPLSSFTPQEFIAFISKDEFDEDYDMYFIGGSQRLRGGRILIEDSMIVLEKNTGVAVLSDEQWNPNVDFAGALKESIITAMRAIIPLCLFLILTMWLLSRKKDGKLNLSGELGIGVTFAVVGMALFVLGILLGLTPLGSQLGGNIPTTFAKLTPWGMEGLAGPLYNTEFVGKLIAVVFGFFLGYGATLAEPALNALGATVEKITVGAFKKSLLMQSVALGVGLGIATGVLKIAYNIPLAYLLIPPYMMLLVLTWFSSEEFVNFGWDSAGVTTGPITVPLVLAMGLGIGGSVPGVIDGFGILALASVGPIITVLTVGLIVARINRDAIPQEV